MVMTSALGNGSAKKSRSIVETRSSRPAADIFRPGNKNGQLASRPTDVAQGSILGEIEFLSEGLKVAGRHAAHCVHELFESLGLAVQFGEHRRARVFDLVLRLSAPESFSEVSPEAIPTSVGHLQEPTDEVGAIPIKEQRRFRRVAIASLRTVAVPLKEGESNESIEEIRVGARVKLQSALQFGARHGLIAEHCEQLKLRGGQQDLRRPEP